MNLSRPSLTRHIVLAVALCAMVGCGIGNENQESSTEGAAADSLIDVTALKQIFHLPGVSKAGNYRVLLPQTVSQLNVDGFTVTRAMGLESWATFYRVDDSIRLVGELIVRKQDAEFLGKELKRVGLTPQLTRAWLGPDGPEIVAIDFTGRGSKQKLGESIRDLAQTLDAHPSPDFSADTLEVANSIDTAPLGLAFLSSGPMVAGVYRVRVSRREIVYSVPGVEDADGLGFENLTYWQGSPDSAAVIGQISMMEPVKDRVAEILRKNGLLVSDPFRPPVDESPSVSVVRFFGNGYVEHLRLAIRDAISATYHHELPEGFEVEIVNRHLEQDAVTFALLDKNRILVGHQRSGRLELIVNGVRRPEPLLVVPNLLWSYEQGFVGVTVDPEFPDSNYVYTFHTRKDSVNRVSRYRITGDLDNPNSDRLSIDESSLKVLVDVFDAYEFHNGGTLRFGPDKKLYVSTGDDAALRGVQDLTQLKAKILRINRDGTAPDDNPVFPSEPPGRLKEIFAIGFRNPFRFTIDPLTGELLVSDVGSVYIEEFNISRGGENFGWPLYEGDRVVYEEARLLPPDPPTFPIYQYDRTSPLCAAIALVAYRPPEGPSDSTFPKKYDGTYFVADFRAGPILNLRKNDQGAWDATTFATGFHRPVDGTRGPDGSIYVLEYGRAIKKIVYRGSGS